MRISTLLCAVALLGLPLTEKPAAAQPPAQYGAWPSPYPSPSVPQADGAFPPYAADGMEGHCLPCEDKICGPAGRFWVRAECLAWWTKGIDLPPLLTTGDAGVLGQPGTRILFGDETVDDEVRLGGRITAGFWFNKSQTIGIEGTFFALEQRSTSYDAASDAAGNPVLARPFFNVLLGQQDALLISFPGLVAGSASFRTNSSDLFGGDLYLRKNLCCGCCYRVDLLGGYRFMNLNEGLGINEVEINLDPEGPVPVGTRFDLNDDFGTKNNFHGGQLGVVSEFRKGPWTLELLAKVAVGANQRTVDINGVTRATVPGQPPVVTPRGFLALPSNSGSHDDTGLSVIPEAGINLKYQVCKHLHLLAGYTFIYWTDVVRPGDQVDLGINVSQIPTGALAGPARPASNFKESDFWAQGLSLGLEFRY